MLLGHNIEQGQRTRDVRISEDITFETMLLTSNILDGLKSSGFYKPSPIQLHGIPLGKCGFDLLLEAKSGTGKTAVFTVIALEKLDFSNGLQAVILAPTREIAAQICDVIKQIGSNYEELKVEVVMGGLPVQEDISKFKNKNVHIVVGSPGRLRHMIQEKYINTSAVRLLILDEADKLMEKSFQADINYIFSVLPKQKQVIMSSATYPETTKSFIDKYVQNAQHIKPDSNSVLLGVQQKITTVKYNNNIVKQTQLRFEELLKILSKKQFKQCLIFCNYQARVMELHKMLTREKWPAEQLYGHQEQIDRLDALKTLQEYKCRILISTDLAARGIDASNVDLIINFEPPVEWQTYLHRIGRAGRFGSYGIAITILSEGKEENKFKEILKSLHVLSHNFWSEDVIYNDDDAFNTALSLQISEIHIHEPLVANDVEVKCRKIWNMLTYNDTMQNKRKIETFEILWKSFEESNNDSKVIEPFTALVNSFQSYQHEGNNNERNNFYELMKAEVMSVQECFVFDNSVKKQATISKEECSHHNNVDSKENGNNSENLNLSDKYEISANSNVNRSSYDARKMNDQEKLRLCDFYNSYVENHGEDNSRYADEFKFETPDATEALHSAGLPTSFGNQKKKLIESKTHKRRNRSRNNFTRYPVVEDYKHHKEYPDRRFVKSQKTKLLDSCEDLYQADQKYLPSSSNNFRTGQKSSPDNVSNDHGYDTLSHQYSRSHSNATYTKHDSNQYYVAQAGISSNRLNQTYLHWFNQLKTRVQQIELAVYIDELSKP